MSQVRCLKLFKAPDNPKLPGLSMLVYELEDGKLLNFSTLEPWVPLDGWEFEKEIEIGPNVKAKLARDVDRYAKAFQRNNAVPKKPSASHCAATPVQRKTEKV